MKLNPRDTVSYQGKDYVVQGVMTYHLAPGGPAKTYTLARTACGQDVLWIEPLTGDLDDRILALREVSDLAVGAPPPGSVLYKGSTYLPRLTGKATVEIAGKVADRITGSCDVWRYRAAGDLFLQIENWNGRLVILAGESVSATMIAITPAK